LHLEATSLAGEQQQLVVGAGQQQATQAQQGSFVQDRAALAGHLSRLGKRHLRLGKRHPRRLQPVEEKHHVSLDGFLAVQQALQRLYPTLQSFHLVAGKRCRSAPLQADDLFPQMLVLGV
jgi:hypothetical protein